MRLISSIFRRRRPLTIDHLPLTIDGIGRAPLTAEPDEAELAAAALLESMGAQKNRNTRSPQNTQSNQKSAPVKGTPAYYHALSQKIREAHAAEARAAQRYISYTEQRLHTAASSDAPGGSLAGPEDNSKFKIHNSKLSPV